MTADALDGWEARNVGDNLRQGIVKIVMEHIETSTGSAGLMDDETSDTVDGNKVDEAIHLNKAN